MVKVVSCVRFWFIYEENVLCQFSRPKKVSPTITEMMKQEPLQNNQNSQQPPALAQELYSSGSNMEESNLGNVDDAIDSVVARAAAEAGEDCPSCFQTIVTPDLVH